MLKQSHTPKLRRKSREVPCFLLIENNLGYSIFHLIYLQYITFTKAKVWDLSTTLRFAQDDVLGGYLWLVARREQ